MIKEAFLNYISQIMYFFNNNNTKVDKVRVNLLPTTTNILLKGIARVLLNYIIKIINNSKILNTNQLDPRPNSLLIYSAIGQAILA